MTFFAGHTGFVRLRRNTQAETFNSVIGADDVNLPLNRIGFDGSLQNLLTGDRITISSTDGSLLSFLPATQPVLIDADTQQPQATWPATQADPAVQTAFTAFINVNLYGGIRFYYSFSDAINNNRDNEVHLVALPAGTEIPIRVEVSDLDFNLVGSITGYTFQTERELIDTTVLSDRFRQQYSAGLISGSGSIDCLFNTDNVGVIEDSLLLIQLIQRVEIGAGFSAELFVLNRNLEGNNTELDVYYQIDAVITRAGVEVQADSIIACSVDFVSTGEINLRVGKAPLDAITQENSSTVYTQFFEVNDLLTEIDD